MRFDIQNTTVKEGLKSRLRPGSADGAVEPECHQVHLSLSLRVYCCSRPGETKFYLERLNSVEKRKARK
jgi:hypothetical protein